MNEMLIMPKPVKLQQDRKKLPAREKELRREIWENCQKGGRYDLETKSEKTFLASREWATAEKTAQRIR